MTLLAVLENLTLLLVKELVCLINALAAIRVELIFKQRTEGPQPILQVINSFLLLANIIWRMLFEKSLPSILNQFAGVLLEMDKVPKPLEHFKALII